MFALGHKRTYTRRPTHRPPENEIICSLDSRINSSGSTSDECPISGIVKINALSAKRIFLFKKNSLSEPAVDIAAMSAVTPIADKGGCGRNVRFVPKVRFTPNNGHSW